MIGMEGVIQGDVICILFVAVSIVVVFGAAIVVIVVVVFVVYRLLIC